MREMREYQQNLLNSNSKITICPWERQVGKTTSIFMDIEQDILNKRGYYHIIVNKSLSICKVKESLLKEYFRFNNNFKLDTETNSEGIMIVSFYDIKNNILLDRIFILCEYHITNVNNRIFTDYYNFKVYYDDYCPSIDGLLPALLKTNSRIYIFNNKIPEDINIINTGKEKYTIKCDENQTLSSWAKQEIEKLKVEFSNIEGRENNTKTREALLSIIKELKELVDEKEI